MPTELYILHYINNINAMLPSVMFSVLWDYPLSQISDLSACFPLLILCESKTRFTAH